MLGIRLGFRVNTVRVQYKMLNVARHYTILVRGIPLPTSRERRSRRTMMSLASTTKVTVRCPHTGRTDRRGPVAALNVASEPRRTRKTRVQSAATSPIVQSTAAVLAFALNASAVQPAFASSEELFTKTCAGCHAAGGNIVQAGATLFPDDLKRNGVDDAAAVYDPTRDPPPLASFANIALASSADNSPLDLDEEAPMPSVADCRTSDARLGCGRSREGPTFSMLL